MGANVLRVLAVVLAAVQLGQAADLFTSAYGHAQSELAAWHAAAAVGLLTGAVRPRLIDALMPVMAGAVARADDLGSRERTEPPAVRGVSRYNRR